MSDIKTIGRYISCVTWLTIPAVLLLSVVSAVAAAPNFSHADIPPAYHCSEIIHSPTFYADYSSTNSNLGDLEIEEVEDDDNELHSKGNLISAQGSAPVPGDISSVYFPTKKKIKLFILFHSWKSYLLN